MGFDEDIMKDIYIYNLLGGAGVVFMDINMGL